MIWILLVSALLMGLLTYAVYRQEPRRLLFGAVFIGFAGTLLSLWSFLMIQGGWERPVIILVVIGGLLFFTAPLIMMGILFYSGIALIRREGFRLTNALAMGLGVAMIGYLFIWPLLSPLDETSWWNAVYGFVGLLVGYIGVVVNLYLVTMLLNLIHVRPARLDYLVVLGAGLDGERVTPLLASRIDKAIELYHKHPSIKLIMTGGQGDDEIVAEGVAMANYAQEKGISSEHIIIEDQAVNTEENIRYSYDKMVPNSRFAVVSNNYHVFRALLLAREQGLDCKGYGAKTKLYFSINATVREFVGYLVLKRKFYGWTLAIISTGYWVLQLLIHILAGLT